MKEYLQKITAREELTREEAAAVMRIIMEGGATDAQISAFLIGMKMKGETADELLGIVEIMREKSVKVRLDDPNAIDMCGTGGDGSGTFNISTVASFVVAGAGVTVAKHGNRSISSVCGSADVLKALGVAIEIPPEKVEACINTVGIGFLFAPLFHPAMKHAAKPRSELGVKTCFNMLGPLTNPAGVQRQLVGAYNGNAAFTISNVFEQLEPTHVCVINAANSFDEMSLETSTDIYETQKGDIPVLYRLDASKFGMKTDTMDSLRGGTAEENANITLSILNGEKGSRRNIVLINAAMGLYVAGKCTKPQDGVKLAEESLDSGNALRKLHALIRFTNS